jgi:hypothetical protein
MPIDFDLEERRWRVVVDLIDAIERLVKTRDIMRIEERFAIAETLRDAADCYDRGKVYCPPSWNEPRLKRRLVPTNRIEDGARLYKLV